MSNSNNIIPVISIDGYCCSGKGTVSIELARRLKWNILDSGALYRILALILNRKNIKINYLLPSSYEILKKYLESINVKFIIEEDKLKTFINDEDVSLSIRSENISKIASRIAIYKTVRDSLSNLLKSFRSYPGLIADGRDMGTIVFPDAVLKIFLTADKKERAKRRLNQLKTQGFKHIKLEDIVDEIDERDIRDSTRLIAPTIPDKKAYIIDTTSLSLEEIITIILNKYNKLV